MIIKKLDLQGFKSFPERTKFVFHPGITVIVGPNGTGKSNIVDALLWVLGGKRHRSLRSERSAEFIFNGNTQKAPMGMADVTLTLSDAKEDLKISHRCFRSGESEYRMDGKAVRLKDIQETLWKKSIGEKDYFVIEQGAIGLFLTSKPLEKRLLLEEAAGTAYYKDKKRQAQNKLENSEQNLTRLEDIIAEVSKSKNSLKRQANAAQRYRKLREKIRLLTSYHFRKKIEELESHQEEAAKLYTQCLNQENKTTMKLKQEEQGLAVKRKNVWNLEKSIQQERDSQYELKARIAKTEAEKDKESRRMEFFKDKQAGAEQNKRELQDELKMLEQRQKGAKKERTALKDTLTHKQTALKKADQDSRSTEKQIQAQQEKIETFRNQYFQHLSEHTEVKNEQAKIEKETDLILRQQEKLQSRLADQQELHKQKRQALQQIESDQAQTQKQLEGKKRSLKTVQRDLEKCQSAIQKTQQHIDTLTAEKDKAQHQLHALDRLEETQRAASSEGIKDSPGLLADLIETDQTHIPLIDILWKEETKAAVISAQKFLELLSVRGIKGNFFLPFPQKKDISLPEAYQDPRVIGHLKSRIRFKLPIKKNLPLLRDAAIVKDITTAVELWMEHPSVNFITTDGDVMFSSGLVQMGGQKEGFMTAVQEKKNLKENIASIEDKLSPLNLRFNEYSQQQTELEKKIQNHTTQADQLARAIQDAEREKALEKAELEKISTNVSLIEKELNTLNRDKHALESKLKTLDDKSIRIDTQEEHAQKTIQKEENTLQSTQKNREQERRRFFELKSETELLREKINTLEEHIQSWAEQKDSGLSKQATLEEDIQNSEREKTKTQERIRNLTEEAQRQESELEEREAKLVQNETHLSQIQAEQKDLENRVEKLREEAETRKEERVKWEIRKAERDRDVVNMEESCWQELKKSLQEVKSEISLENIPEQDTEASLRKAQEELQKYKAVNLMAEEEYEIHKKRHDFLIKERKDLQDSISSTREAIKKIDKESKSQFLKALSEVNTNFMEVFSLLFEGGQAEVKLTDPTQPLESGVDIIAQPPGKRVQSINLLSGGEKALTSLAFFFALFRYKPTPFCVLDEVDAALDEKNLGRFLNLMKKVKEHTQFILITHNYKTMEVADYIYGTTMAEPNITSLYSMKLDTKGTPSE